MYFSVSRLAVLTAGYRAVMALACGIGSPALFFLLAASCCVRADGSYFLMMTSDGPVTSGAMATVNATLLVANGSTTLIADPRLYHFHWSYSPLLLAHHSENDSSSDITLQCDCPGTYPISVWVTERHCSSCEPLSRNATDLQVTKDIVGRLIATQAEANGTFFRNGTFLATKSRVTLLFLIHDPSNFFRTAEFSYTWSFGDGTAVVTTEPFTPHNFSKPGSYQVALQVTARLHSSEFEWHSRKKNGSFDTSLILQGLRTTRISSSNVLSVFLYCQSSCAPPVGLADIISNITIAGPLETTTKQNVSLSLHVLGSPPLTVCWLIKSDCVSLDKEECHPVTINDTTYLINHLFKTAGRYCLSVKAQNEVSVLVNHFSLTIDSAGIHPLWFVLPCCAFIVIAVGFIFYTLFRAASKNTHTKSLVEVADFDFSPVSDKYESLAEFKEFPARLMCCTYCPSEENQEASEEEAETRPLLHTLSASSRNYTM
ncbi:transmembrane protein 130 [Gastrophryne carolinensis]